MATFFNFFVKPLYKEKPTTKLKTHNKKTNKEELKENINYHKYSNSSALGIFMLLKPKKAQVQSPPQPQQDFD
ncbi:hypothetical protein T190115A13A_50221 [Tenacibaculum sp. 190524A02b]|uniref:Uncharacterized protein n=1 Tax=Tenacibaculum vairaonense TaxID=3137860 RepID=A0ABM9PQD0_9FLAO